MEQYVISLRTIDDVKNFVNAVAAMPEDFDVSSGRHTVDGKSIMGLFSLDLSAPLTLTVYGDQDQVYRQRLSAFLA